MATKVQKNEYFSQCEDANVPAGIIPWHRDCDPAAAEDMCELGSSCVTFPAGRSFCEPTKEHELQPADICGGGGSSSAGKVGIAFLVIGLLALLGTAGFGAPPLRSRQLVVKLVPLLGQLLAYAVLALSFRQAVADAHGRAGVCSVLQAQPRGAAVDASDAGHVGAAGPHLACA